MLLINFEVQQDRSFSQGMKFNLIIMLINFVYDFKMSLIIYLRVIHFIKINKLSTEVHLELFSKYDGSSFYYSFQIENNTRITLS